MIVLKVLMQEKFNSIETISFQKDLEMVKDLRLQLFHILLRSCQVCLICKC